MVSLFPILGGKMKLLSVLVTVVKDAFTGSRKNVYIVDKDAKRDIAVELPHKFAAQVAELHKTNR